MIEGKYREIKDLSSGSYGKVCRCSVEGELREVAVKVYVKKQHDSDGEIRHFQCECEALSQLQHPYIVRLLDFKESGTRVDDMDNVTNVRYAALELAENGNLLDYVVDKSMDDRVVRYYFRQLLQGIDFMHNSGYCHRDLKLENILLDNEYNIKISDFGFATSLRGSNQDNQLYDCKGTLRYMAPEIFKGTGYLGRSVDIFALGVILFSMKTGRPPFMRMAAAQDPLYSLLHSYQYDGYWMMWDSFAQQSGFELPMSFKNLFIAMICYYPNSRLSLTEILRAEWMLGEIASEREVQNYMQALQKEMELCDQEQFGKQASAQSNYIVNMKNEEEFDIKETNDVINDVHQIEDKDRGHLIHQDIEDELDLDQDDAFDLGDELEEKSEDLEEFVGHQEENKEEDYSMAQDNAKSLIFPRTEEIDTNLCTVYADKICEYLMEYSQINKLKVFFDVNDFTLNFNIPTDNGIKYFGMKFEFVGPEDGKDPAPGVETRNNYKIYFLKDDNLDEEEFKDIGLHFLEQISSYI
ncbi:unnamed protein product [Moneuplotes crassus]|uniref:Protein kinase domain-containing protein n=2 Tax=Euplotes crassus TaxID=5936 RepID=A0AAD1U9G1_EUPCR|nr:unnamed protein product [Moneuplotes crassus]